MYAIFQGNHQITKPHYTQEEAWSSLHTIYEREYHGLYCANVKTPSVVEQILEQQNRE